MHKVDPKIKQRAIHRAKILEGQFRALLKGIQEETYCPELLHQSLSIQKSLKSLDRLLLENHLKSHVPHQIHEGKESQAISELMDVFELSNK